VRWSCFDGQQCCLENKRHDHEKGPSESTCDSKNMARRRRKHDEEFKQQALAMARNG
jgi:hypothetical protein